MKITTETQARRVHQDQSLLPTTQTKHQLGTHMAHTGLVVAQAYLLQLRPLTKGLHLTQSVHSKQAMIPTFERAAF